MTHHFSLTVSRLPRTLCLTTIVLSVSLVTAHAVQAKSQTLDVHNLNPLITNIATAALSDHWADPNRLLFSTQYQLANYFASSFTANDVAWVDGETHRLDVALRYGLSEQWQAGISFPLLRHGHGFLDHFIFNFHDTLGFPQGGRKSHLNDQYLLAYQTHETTVYYNDRASKGIGDTKLQATHRALLQTGELFTEFAIELPTGDKYKLTGSGGTDVSLGSLLVSHTTLSNQVLTWWGGLGLSYSNEKLNHLGVNSWPLAINGRLGFGYPLSDQWQLKIQTDMTSAHYHSDTKVLGFPSLQLHLATTYELDNNQRWSAGISEDLISKSSPDVTFLVSYEIGFAL
ncbi:MAG: DUF3187 family protein [Hahellaceae bacterium]|nr:DUF3187 family protein [Hahellaceae bacterium]MCP5169066.1 DUF3187 family protein [Hahellaceae bacterium]